MVGLIDQILGNNDADTGSQGSPTAPQGTTVAAAPAQTIGNYDPLSAPMPAIPSGGFLGGDPGLQGFAVGMLSTPKHAGFGRALANGQLGYIQAQQDAYQRQIANTFAPANAAENYRTQSLNNQLLSTVTLPQRQAALQLFRQMGANGIPGQAAPPPQAQPAIQQQPLPPQQPMFGGNPPPMNPQQMQQAGQGQPQIDPALMGAIPASQLGMQPPSQGAAPQLQQVQPQQGQASSFQPAVPMGLANQMSLLGLASGAQNPFKAYDVAAPSNGQIYGTDAQGNAMVQRPIGWDQNVANTAGAEKMAQQQVLARTQPGIDAATQAAKDQVDLQMLPAIKQATTLAENAANAGKPITPQEREQTQLALSKEFQDNAQVKDYYEIAKNYKTALQAAADNTTSSDINLVDAAARTFNPGASVRNSTYQLFAEHSQGLPDNILGAARSVFNGNRLDPQTRQQLIEQMTHRMDSVRSTYNQLATAYTNNAQAVGANPSAVVPNFVDPLTAQEELARRRAAAAAK